MRIPGWVVVVSLSLALTGSHAKLSQFSDVPPPQRVSSTADPLIRLRIVVDEIVAARHGDRLESYLQEAVAIHNVEWRRVRREWFTISEVVVEPAAGVRDALYVLANLVHKTTQEPGTIHVKIIGEPLEIYSNGVSARPIGGLAFRGSDALVVSATQSVTADLLAYYLFHEIGHCWDAFDLPFGGGHSTFGHKQFATFDVDAGNAQIMEDSPGPRRRDTPLLAPSVIRAKLAAARAAARDPIVFRDLHDLMLHEASPANPVYVRKRDALLARAGADRPAIARLLKRYEITAHHARHDAAARNELAEHYWTANDAIKRGDLATAEEALATIESLHAAELREEHLLVAAVGKKVRRRK